MTKRKKEKKQGAADNVERMRRSRNDRKVLTRRDVTRDVRRAKSRGGQANKIVISPKERKEKKRKKRKEKKERKKGRTKEKRRNTWDNYSDIPEKNVRGI